MHDWLKSRGDSTRLGVFCPVTEFDWGGFATNIALRESQFLLFIEWVRYKTVFKYPGYTWSADYYDGHKLNEIVFLFRFYYRCIYELVKHLVNHKPDSPGIGFCNVTIYCLYLLPDDGNHLSKLSISYNKCKNILCSTTHQAQDIPLYLDKGVDQWL